MHHNFQDVVERIELLEETVKNLRFNQVFVENSQALHQSEKRLNVLLHQCTVLKELLQKEFPQENKVWARVQNVANTIGALYEELLGQTVSIPVLMYHDVVSDNEFRKLLSSQRRYCVSLSAFKEQMKWLAGHGYEAITLSDVKKYLAKEVLLKKPVVITFDDALKNVELAGEVMREHDFKGVVSVVTKTIEEEKVKVNPALEKETLSLDDLKTFEKSGWQVVSHSHDLHHLGEKDIRILAKTVSNEEFLKQVEEDLRASKAMLDDHFPNQENDILVWPFNFYRSEVVKIAQRVGFKVLVTTDVHQMNSILTMAPKKWFFTPVKHWFSSFVHKFTDPRYITRIEISGGVTLDEFVRRVTVSNYLFVQKMKRKIGWG